MYSKKKIKEEIDRLHKEQEKYILAWKGEPITDVESANFNIVCKFNKRLAELKDLLRILK